MGIQILIHNQFTMIILVILLLVTLSSPIKVVRTAGEINEYNVIHHWDDVAELLNNLQSLSIKRGLTQNSLHKILTSPLPKLEELSFGQQRKYLFQADDSITQTQVLTQMLIKDVLTSEYFPNLKSINLQQTGLDDRSFAFLQENITIRTKLSDLNLGRNYISFLGLRRLSKIHFQQLVNLNLNNNLLIQNQAADAVINIICQNQPNHCPNQLESLLIKDTHIPGDAFARLISKINKTTIKELDLSGMTFKFKQTLNEGFNYSAYEFLDAQSFPALQTLRLSRQLNDDIGKIFRNWKLPNLKNLQIDRHPIGNEGVMSWLTKDNMPNLNYLSVHTTDITDVGFAHIIAQNFSLTYLDIGETKLSNKGVLLCAKLQTPLKFLNLQNLKLSSTYLKRLFIEMNLQDLLQLSLDDNTEISDLFLYFPWKRLQNLTILRLNGCDFVDSYQRLFQNIQVLLPKLQILFFMDNDKTLNTLILLFYYVPQLFPKIKQIYLSDYMFIPIPQIYIEKSLPFYKEGTKINLRNVQIVKSENKFKIRALGRLVALLTQQNTQMSLDQIVSNMNRIFDFSQLEILGLTNIDQLYFFLQILKATYTSSLNNLTMLLIWQRHQAADLIPMISQLSLPVLNALLCEMNISPDLDQTFLQQTIIPFFQNFPQLVQMRSYINFVDDNQATSFRKILFDSLNYPFLQVIDVHTMEMEVDEIEQFMRVHGNTLRTVNFMADFFEKGFLEILVDIQITLQNLDLSKISFTPKQFSYLGKINTGFLTDLALNEADLTNAHILSLIEEKGSGQIFPNLKTLLLQGNDIRKQGLQLLMKSGLYSLTLLQMKYNNIPQFINILLKYPSQIRILKSDQIEVYSIEPDLNPLSVAQLQALGLTTNSFTRQDFFNFGKLFFNRLRQCVIYINNIYDCEVLKDLLKINMWADRGEIIITNDQSGLNSSCLKDMANYTSQMSMFGIQDVTGSIYIPEFIELLLNSERTIKNIVLINTRLSPASLSKIFSKDMHSITQIVLTNNYLDDSTFQQLMKSSNFIQLAILQLSSTQITDQSIKKLSITKLPALKILRLSNNNISWKSIEYLTKLNAPFLQKLSLDGCELDGFSLQFIKKFTFTYLRHLDLNNNKFTEEELVQFVLNLDQLKKPSLAFLDLRGVPLNKQNYNNLREFLERKNIQYRLSPPYNLQQVNSASY